MTEFNPQPAESYDSLKFQFSALCSLYNSTRQQMAWMQASIIDMKKQLADGAASAVASQREANNMLTCEVEKYSAALEQIKLYHENMHGARAKDFIAYDIACKALEECNDG